MSSGCWYQVISISCDSSQQLLLLIKKQSQIEFKRFRASLIIHNKRTFHMARHYTFYRRQSAQKSRRQHTGAPTRFNDMETERDSSFKSTDTSTSSSSKKQDQFVEWVNKKILRKWCNQRIRLVFYNGITTIVEFLLWLGPVLLYVRCIMLTIRPSQLN